MFHSRLRPGYQRAISVIFSCCLSIWGNRLSAQTPAPPSQPQDAPAKPDSTAVPAPAAATGQNEEVSSRDTPTTFKVRVNLVLVRVVVRDSQGNVVPNLKKEDFQLFDNRKVQTISNFSVETPESHTVAAVATDAATGEAPAEISPGASAKLPQRFVSVVFDDTDLKMDDAVTVRAAAGKLFGSLAPSDRVGIYTTSGQFTQEFTSDHESLQKSLFNIIPHPLSTAAGVHPCPEVNYYEADRI